MKKSIRDRIKITKKGKVKRRAQGLGHNRSKWDSNRKHRKTGEKELNISEKKAKELLNQSSI